MWLVALHTVTAFAVAHFWIDGCLSSARDQQHNRISRGSPALGKQRSGFLCRTASCLASTATFLFEQEPSRAWSPVSRVTFDGHKGLLQSVKASYSLVTVREMAIAVKLAVTGALALPGEISLKAGCEGPIGRTRP